MSNLMDYLDWRGDLTFREAPFNEVDNLILAQLVYVEFAGIVPAPGEEGTITVKEACELFFAAHDRKEIMVMPSPEEAPVFKEKEGQYRIYVMLPFDASRNFEIYQGELDGKAQMESESYGEQTWEYLTVVSGEIELILDDQSFHVKRGSSLYFACDRKHVYRNAGEEKAVCNMIITTQH